MPPKIPFLSSVSPVAPPAAYELFTQKTPFLTVLMDKEVPKGGVQQVCSFYCPYLENRRSETSIQSYIQFLNYVANLFRLQHFQMYQHHQGSLSYFSGFGNSSSIIPRQLQQAFEETSWTSIQVFKRQWMGSRSITCDGGGVTIINFCLTRLFLFFSPGKPPLLGLKAIEHTFF